MNQYNNPIETPKKEVPESKTDDLTQIKLYVIDLNKRIGKIESELIKISSELKTTRDLAHSVARRPIR